MSITALTLLAALGVGQDGPDLYTLNSRTLSIPIRVNPSKRHEIRELRLWVSTDEGKNWRVEAMASPDKEAFPYYAPDDGLYWFTISIEDLNGRREPANMFKATPGLKLLVDTVPPVVKVKPIEKVGDELQVGWEVEDKHLDPTTLKVEARVEGGSWQPVTVPVPGPTGTARFKPTAPGAVTVRVQVADKANNTGTGQQIAAASLNPLTSEARPALVDASPMASKAGAFELPPTVTTAPDNLQRTTSVEPAPTDLPSAHAAPEPKPQFSPVIPQTPVLPSAPQVQPAPRIPPAPAIHPPAASPAMIAQSQPAGPVFNAQSQPTYPPLGGYGPSTSNYASGGVVASNQGAPAASSSAAAAPVQLINTTTISLAYEVTKKGPSGLSAVELWITRDDGLTWDKCADDPDLQSPITTQLPGEGTYGLRLVVQSRAGLTQGPPQSGDKPEMRVEVDLTPPSIQLYQPEPDRTRANTLIMRWQAEDKNLTATPITLEWAEQSSGPWMPITTSPGGVPNTGTYPWTLPSDMRPYRVYLRALARDTAGNVGEARTMNSVLIDLTTPQAQIKQLLLNAGPRP